MPGHLGMKSQFVIGKLDFQQRSLSLRTLSIIGASIHTIISPADQRGVENCISRRRVWRMHGSILSLQFPTMASEPSSTTIASEPSTSTSEIQTDTSEPSQLEVLALNYLRNQEISTIPSRIPKLNPCSICQRVILKFRFQSFVVLDCEHLFHCQCLEKYIMQAETEPPLTCPSCNVIIEMTREEAVLASGKYHLQKKQTDTGQGNKELMTLLGW